MNFRLQMIAGLVLIIAALAFAFGWMRYKRIPENVAYVTEEDGAISVIDLRTMTVTHRVHPADFAPRGLAITFDGKFVITANKNTKDISVFSTPRLDLVRRIHIGDNPEFVKINPAGNMLLATFEPGAVAGPPPANPKETADENEPPAQIASFHIPGWSPGPVRTAGKETEGMEFSRDGKYLLIANEAENSIGIYDAAGGARLQEINLEPYGQRPRGIKASPVGSGYVVTMEGSGTLLALSNDFKVTKSVPTAAKPYGVAFDRSGVRVFAAAAQARKLQVYSAGALELLAEIPVGQRCWHFTFTPDDAKILLACGRSNNIVVVDANSYKPLQTIEGFKLPWGIVTNPRSYGSMGLP